MTRAALVALALVVGCTAEIEVLRPGEAPANAAVVRSRRIEAKANVRIRIKGLLS